MTTESECRELLCKLLQGTSPVRSRYKSQLSDHSQFSTPRPVARAESGSDDSNLVLEDSKFTTSFRRHAPPVQHPLNRRLVSLGRQVVSYTSAVTLFAFSLFILAVVASLEKDLYKDAVIIA
ncbi:MAG: uncharacterized protein KVP18_005032 [Porospora cf. gigantea A]|uniref:uncharacterized protein n=1 Tax=Porospora cf. gigantea A TaxID=2853593 RepID=UPI003559A634|nr:MAG: hypothetical protein KVP18_005032 [Porospora cf. gigantea A]